MIADETTATLAPRKQAIARLPRGASIGRYIVLELLGAGGMGVVYLAYDPELDRRIAIKLVRDQHGAQSQLLAEAQALAKVTHPNVIAIHDVGTHAGAVFIAMELAVGKTLAAWKKSATAPAQKQILDVFLAAGRGLVAAHAVGIVHRDFKPANVIVGDDGRVRVVDFGLARADRSESGTEPSASPVDDVAEIVTGDDTVDLHPGAAVESVEPVVTGGPTSSREMPRVIASRAMGTPTYMAPEQRKAGTYDARVDQYAFGVALYEALYGERPFAGTTEAELDRNEREDRVRPVPRGVVVPAHLRRALVRAVRAAPDERFPTMAALLAALADDPRVRRRRAIAVATTVAAAGAVAVLLLRRDAPIDPCATAGEPIAGAWNAERAAAIERAFVATKRPYAPDVAHRVAADLAARADGWRTLHVATCVAHRDGSSSDELFDRTTACLDHRRDELRALTAQLASGPDAALVDHALAAIAALPAATDCADRDRMLAAVPLPKDPAKRAAIAAVRVELAEVDAQGWTGEYQRARERAGPLVDAATATGYAPVMAEAAWTAAQAYRRASDLPHAEAALYDAARDAASARDDALAADVWIELVSVVGYELARGPEGLALIRIATAATARAGDPPQLAARLLHARALVTSSNDKAAAIPFEAAALALRERGSDEYAIAESVNALALLHGDHGDYTEAEALHRRALALREKLLGDAHPLVAESISNLGVILYHEGKLDLAKPMYERALAMRIAALGPDHVDVGTTLNNLGGLYLDLGDDARATDYLERALANWEHNLGPEHPDLAIPLANLGDLANREGKHAIAQARCERALRIEQKADHADNPDLAYNLDCIGEAQLGAKHATEALATFERALHLRDGADGDPGELARTQLDVALALPRAELARARTLVDKACPVLASQGPSWRARAAVCAAWQASHR